MSGAPAAPEESPRPDPRPPAAEAPRRQPGALELLRWSLILMGISLLIAALAIPLLRWLGLDG